MVYIDYPPVLRRGIIFLVTYIISTVLYRLYFHPLARFPGPRLAAITQWYEVYWQMVKPGQLTFHVEDLHKRYGTIVRMSPWQLHISDPDYFETVYSRGHREKAPEYVRFFDAPLSAVATIDHDLHRLRRSALEPSFSKANVRLFAPCIQDAVDTLIARVDTEHAGTDKPLTLSDVLSCFGGHIIAAFCFTWKDDFLLSPNFKSPLLDAFDVLAKYTHIAMYFPFVLTLIGFVPVKFLGKDWQTIRKWQQNNAECMRELIDRKTTDGDTDSYKPAMEAVVNSDLPPEEKGYERLSQEADILFAAGQSTSKVLIIAMFHLLQQPLSMEKLRNEILDVYPNPREPPSLSQLEKLPYLTSVLMEALRLAYGNSARTPRIANIPLTYGPYTIPAHTRVSMSQYSVSNHSALFPTPQTFNAERFLDDPMAPKLNTPGSANVSGTRKLSRYMVTFGRGGRHCVGQHLAWAQLYIMMAGLVRRCELKLWETAWRDVGFVREYSQMYPAEDSKGLRVMVKSVV